jgi:hypothetical protein
MFLYAQTIIRLLLHNFQKEAKYIAIMFTICDPSCVTILGPAYWCDWNEQSTNWQCLHFSSYNFIISYLGLISNFYHRNIVYTWKCLCARHEGLLSTGGRAPLISNLDTGCKWAVRFTIRTLKSRWKTRGAHWVRGWVGPRSSLVGLESWKISRPCWEWKHDTLVVQLAA